MATSHRNQDPNYLESITVDISNFEFGFVVSDWNKEITENLFKGAKTLLLEKGAKEEHLIRWDVPGTFELVYGAQKMISCSKVDAVIVIGCVIQGETKHFDYVCSGVTQGVMHLNATQKTPVIFCVLTDNHIQQSIERSGGKLGNKGEEAALAAIKMISISQNR